MESNTKKLIRLILAGVAMAMGVAVVVLPLVDQSFSLESAVSMLGIGVFLLGLLALDIMQKKRD